MYYTKFPAIMPYVCRKITLTWWQVTLNLAAKQLLTLRGLLVYTGADSSVHWLRMCLRP